MAARGAEGDLDISELPIGEAPTRFSITASSAGELLPAGGADPARQLLLGLAPVSGEATASSDEIRAQAAVSP